MTPRHSGQTSVFNDLSSVFKSFLRDKKKKRKKIASQRKPNISQYESILQHNFYFVSFTIKRNGESTSPPTSSLLWLFHCYHIHMTSLKSDGNVIITKVNEFFFFKRQMTVITIK